MKRAAHLLPAVCLAAVLVVAARAALADEPTAPALSAATVLFDRGKALAAAGRYAEACPQFEAAQRLVAGIGVTLYLGDCYEQTTRLASAWTEFDKARAMADAKHDDRARVARERADRLWPRLSKVRLVVSPGADVAGLVVTEDGAVVDRVSFDAERPVEPGTHHFAATAPHRARWEVAVDVPVTPGSLRVEVPRLADVEPPPDAPPVPATVAPPPREQAIGPPPLPAERPAPVSAQRVAGIAIFGVGLVAVTAGAVFGLQAKSQMDRSNASGHCQPDDHCDAAGVAERADALHKATLSTIGFIGGLACVGAGTVLYLVAPRQPSGMALAARAGPNGGSVLLEGGW